MKLQGMAVAWFRQEDWPRWCAMDPGFQPDYEHWRERIEEAFARYQAEGVPVVKVTLDPDEFLEWSRGNNAGVGTKARATFAAFKGQSLDTPKDTR